MSEPAGQATRRRRFTVDDLFQDTSPRGVGVEELVGAKDIRLERITPDPGQPRQSFDDERLQELAASIRQEGILQPIAVRYEPQRDRYIILHGERRWRAAALAGIETIPAVVRDVPEDRRLLQQLMENVVREDLNALDRAAGLRALKQQMDDAPWERVAEAVGIRRSRLFQLLGTEKLPDVVQEQIRNGRLSEKQSRVLQGLPEPAQEAIASLIADEGLSAQVAQRLARAARVDGEIDELDRQALAERFRSMRDSLESSGRRTRSSTSSRELDEALSRLQLDTCDDGRAVLNDDPSALADTAESQLIVLARHLEALRGAELTAEQRERLDNRLRSFRDLITAFLDS